MNSNSVAKPDPAQQSILRWLVILALAFGVAMIFAWRYADSVRDAMVERARSEAALVVDSRAAAVDQWLKEQVAGLESLAGNQALGLYLMTAIDGSEPQIVAGQAGYLRSLLDSHAARGGFISRRPEVRANVPLSEAPGLALVGSDGTLIARTGGPIPPPTVRAAQLRQSRIDGLARLDGKPALRLAVPIAAPMGDETIGFIHAMRWLDEPLAQALVQPGDTQAGSQIYLVGRGGPHSVYIIAPADQQAGSSAALDPAAKIGADGRADFLQASGRDGAPVFVTARPIGDTGWLVVRTVPERLVTAPADQRRTLLLSALVGGLTALAALVLLAWRNNAVVVARKALAQESESRAYFERLANVQPTGLAVVAPGGAVRFANATLASWRPQAMAGADSAEAMFGGFAAPIQDVLARLARGDAPVMREARGRFDDGGPERRLQLQAVALPQPGEALVVAEDVTALVTAHERREQTLDALVHTLMGLIDARDPGSAHHSDRVAQLARQVGQTLGWPPLECDTLATAGLLLNVGKLFAPRSLLTKTQALSEAERTVVRQAMAQASQLLARVPFEGPVAETLDQVHGPQGLRQRSARLLVLVNALVSMVSPRAHRAALSPEAALAQLRLEAAADDQALVNALAHTLDNLGAKAVVLLTEDAAPQG